MNTPVSYEPMPQYFSLRVALVYGIHFIYFGLYIPYFPLWLEDQALNEFQISTVLAMPLLIRVLTSGLVTTYADAQPDRASFVGWLYFFSSVGILFYLPSESFWPILVITLLFNIFFNPILPLLDAFTMSAVKRFGVNFGNLRSWGSLFFIIANIAGGMLLEAYGTNMVLIALIASMWIGFIFSLLLPRIGRRKIGVSQDDEITRKALLKNKRFCLILLAGGVAQAAHALLYGFGSIYWASLGFDKVVIGVFWAVGVLSEIILLNYSKRLSSHFSAISFIVFGCIGGVIRWMLFPFIDDTLSFLLLQILHGASFGAVYMGMILFVSDTVPDEKLGTAQGIGFVLGGVVMGLAVFCSGPLYSYLGKDGFFVMAGMCLIALFLLLFVNKHYPQSSGSAGNTLEPS